MAALLLFAGCWLGGYLFPWWWPALAACAVGAWLPRRSGLAALSGFLGAGAAWAAAAAWQDVRNHHILSARVAPLFHLPGPAGAIAATGAVGGLMGALGAWAGYALRQWLLPRAQSIEPPPFAEARKAAADAAGSESSGGTGLSRAEARNPLGEDIPSRAGEDAVKAGAGEPEDLADASRTGDAAGEASPGKAAEAPLTGDEGEPGR